MCPVTMPSSTLFPAAVRVSALLAALLATPAAGAVVPAQNDDIAELSLEELANIQVTSVSKR